MDKKSEFDPLLSEATYIAERASQIALSYFRQSALLIEMKENMTPVTIADKKTEEYIREALGKSFPAHSILGEEFGQDRKDSEFMWTVDPIDGTRSFIRGIPLFGTLIGLLRDKEPVLGVMVLPGLGETYTSAKHGGSYCNGVPLHTSPIHDLSSAMISCGDFYTFEDTERTDYLASLMKRAHLVRSYTDCFGHSLVLRGSLDAMIDPVVSTWDIVPIASLVGEAGGEFFNFEGSEDLFQTSFISCAPGLREELLNLSCLS